VKLTISPKDILAMDTEVANGWWWYDGKSTHRLMIFVGQWLHKDEPFGWILLPDVIVKSTRSIRKLYDGLPIVTRREGLTLISNTIEDADTLVGHNLTGFDIGTINGELKLQNMPLLPVREVVDTLKSAKPVMGQAMSLANRLSRLEGTVDKPHVNPVVWSAAFNDFDPDALREVWNRAVLDVQGHIDLYHNDTERSYV
jgi:hypothetical protein